MQLDCKRHWVSGVRADSSCSKCARRQEKKIAIDTTSKTVHFFDSTSANLSRSADHQRPATSETVTNGSIRPRAKRCSGCGAASVGIVFGMESCVRCGEHINSATEPRPYVGEAMKAHQSELRQMLRRR